MPPWANDLINLLLGPAGLAVFLLLVLYGLHKQFWVPGSQYRDCTERRRELEVEAKAAVQAQFELNRELWTELRIQRERQSQ